MYHDIENSLLATKHTRTHTHKHTHSHSHQRHRRTPTCVCVSLSISSQWDGNCWLPWWEGKTSGVSPQIGSIWLKAWRKMAKKLDFLHSVCSEMCFSLVYFLAVLAFCSPNRDNHNSGPVKSPIYGEGLGRIWKKIKKHIFFKHSVLSNLI